MNVRKIAVPVLAVALLAPGGMVAAAKTSPSVMVRHTKLGRILVDTHGRTLYLFEKDKRGKSACAGACAANWPPLMATGKPTAARGASAGKLGTTHRKSGLQVTYAGHPLYRFSGDSRPGQTNGEGLKAFGAEWYVLSPAGKKVEKAGS